MARTGLPKKYAKLGFKKGWAAFKKFKGTKGQFNTLRLKSKKSPRPVVTVHKRGAPQMAKAIAIAKSSKVAALKSRLSSALKRAKGAVKASDPKEAAFAIGEGFVGGVATSYLFGSIPTGSIPKPALVKSVAQTLTGAILAIQKNKHLRYVGYGTAIVGLVSVARELLPIPTFAGEVDTALFGDDFNGEEELLGYDENGMPVFGTSAQMSDPIMGDPIMGDPIMGDPIMGGEVTASPF